MDERLGGGLEERGREPLYKGGGGGDVFKTPKNRILLPRVSTLLSLIVVPFHSENTNMAYEIEPRKLQDKLIVAL